MSKPKSSNGKSVSRKKLDKAAREVVEKFAGVPESSITTGALQKSFHDRERKAHRGEYSGHFPIVGVGASAGGVESYSELLSLLPDSTGMAFILVQHLAPKHESLLPAILSRISKMPVIKAESDMPVEPNRVYVIPPNTNMGIINGVLKLSPRLESPARHMPVDFFFRCLSDDQAHLSIGIILSGGDGDGSQGLRAIRAQGGITIVQDPKTAKVDGMPRNAIAAGGTDCILPIPSIAKELIRLGAHPFIGAKDEMDALPDDLSQIFRVLRARTGVDFSKYKKGTILRRLRRRILIHGVTRTAEYLEILKRDAEESDHLFGDLLINVTSFFRDVDVFETLKKEVFPQLLRRRPVEEPLRFWVPGCSTGEEPYSFAMAITEAMESLDIHRAFQIFASDLSEAALNKAREGYYVDSIIVDVSQDRLRRFFIKAAGGYRVSPEIRQTCVFAKHDVTRDPPFSRMDFISCRNLLIYLETAQQKRVTNLFAYALNPNGYLLLGSSESANTSENFDSAFPDVKIYSRKSIVSRDVYELPPAAPRVPGLSFRARPRIEELATKLDLHVDRLILGRFSPAAVVVDDSMQILQFRGKTGRFLEPTPGGASFDLFKMAKPGLDTELRVVMAQAKKTGRPVRKENVPLRGGKSRLTIEVIPLRLVDEETYFLILLGERREKVPVPAALPRERNESNEVKRLRVELQSLNDELTSTREHLNSIIREQETSNEEMQAANEEVLSGNEELQSTNEELETAKEELQSTNEELTTVNEELSTRNLTLSRASNDLNNLLASVSLPILMVGNDLRIRRFTPMAEKILNVIPTDIGRPVTDIKPNFDIPDLDVLITSSIEKVQTVEREVRDRSGVGYMLRIRPYRTAAHQIDGAVLILLDVNPNNGGGSEDLVDPLLDSIRQSLVLLDSGLKIIYANRAFLHSFGLRPSEVLGQDLLKLSGGAWGQPVFKALLNDTLASDHQVQEYKMSQDFPGLGQKAFMINARRIDLDQTTCVLMIIDETT